MSTSSSEKTPLIAGRQRAATAPGASTFYFAQRGAVHPNTAEITYEGSAHQQTGEEVEVNVLPEGTTAEDFASRPVIHSDHSGIRPNPPKKNFFTKIFGRKESKPEEVAAAAPSGLVGSLVKQRKVPIKVEPKVFFANERTFLAWLHTSVLLAGASIAIVAFAHQNPFSQLYGIVLLPVAIAFIAYAMIQCEFFRSFLFEFFSFFSRYKTRGHDATSRSRPL